MTLIKCSKSDKDLIAKVCALNDTGVLFFELNEETVGVQIDTDDPQLMWYMARAVESEAWCKQIKEEIL